jgi:hypothetical protein
MAVITMGCGHSPLKALFVPLIVAFDTLLVAVSGDVGRCLLVAAQRCLPASLCWAKHGHIVASGALGGNVV